MSGPDSGGNVNHNNMRWTRCLVGRARAHKLTQGVKQQQHNTQNLHDADTSFTGTRKNFQKHLQTSCQKTKVVVRLRVPTPVVLLFLFSFSFFFYFSLRGDPAGVRWRAAQLGAVRELSGIAQSSRAPSLYIETRRPAYLLVGGVSLDLCQFFVVAQLC